VTWFTKVEDAIRGYPLESGSGLCVVGIPANVVPELTNLVLLPASLATIPLAVGTITAVLPILLAAFGLFALRFGHSRLPLVGHVCMAFSFVQPAANISPSLHPAKKTLLFRDPG